MHVYWNYKQQNKQSHLHKVNLARYTLHGTLTWYEKRVSTCVKILPHRCYTFISWGICPMAFEWAIHSHESIIYCRHVSSTINVCSEDTDQHWASRTSSKRMNRVECQTVSRHGGALYSYSSCRQSLSTRHRLIKVFARQRIFHSVRLVVVWPCVLCVCHVIFHPIPIFTATRCRKLNVRYTILIARHLYFDLWTCVYQHQ